MPRQKSERLRQELEWLKQNHDRLKCPECQGNSLEDYGKGSDAKKKHDRLKCPECQGQTKRWQS